MPVRVNFNLSAEARQGLDAVEVEMTQIGEEIVKHAVRYLDDNEVNDTRLLGKSIVEDVDRFLNLIRLKVGAGAKYAPYVHFGTKPHWPKREPIVQWAKRKFALTDKEAQRVGYLVARKISRDGTEAKPFMDHALNQVAGRFAERMGAAFIRGMG